MEQVINQLKKLTKKKYIILTPRGNKAIQLVLKALKNKKSKLFIQDQGGWITYKQFGAKYKYKIIELKTYYGIIKTSDLKNTDKNSILLFNSLTGYFAEQPVDDIISICKKTECLTINDISGSIGFNNLLKGDILICSFGKDKPINLGYGGLIATNNKEFYEKIEPVEFNQEKLKDLNKILMHLKERITKLKNLHIKIKQNLNHLDIIHKRLRGINVIIKFNNENQKKEIIDYCNKNNLEYTICPRSIRVLENAVSIEVKRK